MTNMKTTELFDIPEDDESFKGSEECPTCGMVPTLDGPTLGCHDAMGCGMLEAEDEEEDDDELENEDDQIKELDFG